MAEPKTRPTGEDVQEYLNQIDDERRRQDCFVLLGLMKEVTGQEPKLWASSMVGFGQYHYRYASGHEGDAFRVGFAPRKQNLAVYVLTGFEQQEELLASLGKHKTGKVCLYLNRLADIQLPVLREMIEKSYEHMRKQYP